MTDFVEKSLKRPLYEKYDSNDLEMKIRKKIQDRLSLKKQNSEAINNVKANSDTNSVISNTMLEKSNLHQHLSSKNTLHSENSTDKVDNINDIEDSSNKLCSINDNAKDAIENCSSNPDKFEEALEDTEDIIMCGKIDIPLSKSNFAESEELSSPIPEIESPTTIKEVTSRRKKRKIDRAITHSENQVISTDNEINIEEVKLKKASPTKPESRRSKRCKVEQQIYRPPAFNEKSGTSPLLRGEYDTKDDSVEIKTDKNNKWGSRSYCQIMQEKRSNRRKAVDSNAHILDKEEPLLTEAKNSIENKEDDEDLLLRKKNEILVELATINECDNISQSETQPVIANHDDMARSSKSEMEENGIHANESLLTSTNEELSFKDNISSLDMSIDASESRQNSNSEMQISSSSVDKQESSNPGVQRLDSYIDDMDNLIGDVDDNDEFDLSNTNDDLLLEMKELLS